METLKWRQDAVGLHVSVSNPENVEAVFTIGNTFINFLMAGTPRLYLVYVKMDGSDDEHNFVLDLEALRPVINKTNGLKITKSRQTAGIFITSGQRIGMYCLARGESYSDRFLGDSGWQAQRVYHDICAVQASSSAVQNTTPPQQPPTPTQQPSTPIQDDDLDLDLTL